MSGIFIIAEKNAAAVELHSGLTRKGFVCSYTSNGREIFEQIAEHAPDLVLMEMNGNSQQILELSQKIKEERRLLIIALVNRETLNIIDGNLDIDDFVIQPCDLGELTLRIRRILRRNNNTDYNELITCGDLIIDPAKCELSVAGIPVMLTFKEYELLKFLASNRGRVFTREALLNRVWGYDYYGGDRTVDVHIRRLRSKIEDTSHTFIETVRHIGYRFRKDV